MRIVVAMDKFRGSLDAAAACAAVAAGLRGEIPGAEIEEIPMADGGEGTADALARALDGRWIPARVAGPIPGREVDAGYVWIPDRRLAVVEMAAASGLGLLEPGERDPLRTTTFGTGQLLLESVHRGAEEIWLGVGGSATVDGGTGAAAALGWMFLDAAGDAAGLGGAALERIEKVVRPPVFEAPSIEVLCDVDNPLCGPRGAAPVFGPQKGADHAVVDRLARGLDRLAERVRADLGIEVADLPGGGAAGGMAAGAHAFFGARLARGIDRVMEAVGLADALSGADWVITGEGRLDDQSLGGKVVAGVAKAARAVGVRVAVVAGDVRLAPDRWRAAGVDAAAAARPDGIPIEDAMRDAARLVGNAAGRVAAGSITGG